MQSHPIVDQHKRRSVAGRVLRLMEQNWDGDALVLVGVPLLIVVGAILGVINLLACIHLIAVLING